MKTARAPIALLLAIWLATLSACGGGEDDLPPTPSPAASPAATPSGTSETALREAVTAYHRAATGLDPATAYASEPAEFRETCPFATYEDMLASLWPAFLDNCGFDDPSGIDFVIEDVEMHEDWARVVGCWEGQSARPCCYESDLWEHRSRWDYRDGAWVPAYTLPCAYAQENERLLETLPELPGAKLASIESLPYTRSEASPDKHFIRVTYETPSETTAQDVIDFYVQSLAAEWQYSIHERPSETGDILVADFRRWSAVVGVDTAAMFEGGPYTFDLFIDYKGAER